MNAKLIADPDHSEDDERFILLSIHDQALINLYLRDCVTSR